MADKPFVVFESVHWMFRLFAYLMEPNKNGNEIEQCYMLREGERERKKRERERGLITEWVISNFVSWLYNMT